ncbi:ABC transporter permease [Mycobacterium sp. C31M]
MTDTTLERDGAAKPVLSESDIDATSPAPPPRRSVAARLRKVRVADALAALALLTVLAWILVPGVFAGQDPLIGEFENQLLPPGAAHLFGTDQLGRDIWARTVHGTLLTIKGAAIAVAIAFGFGTLLGLVAGTLGGAVEAVSMRVVDVLVALPGFLVALLIVTALGSGIVTVAVAIGVASIATFARVIRAEVLRVRKFEFVEAAALSGFTLPHILFREILPNSAGPVLALVAIEISQSIVAIAALSFLGYGEPPPTPEWGLIISEGRNYLAEAWWITTLPGIVLIVTVVSFARISRRIQQWRLV